MRKKVRARWQITRIRGSRAELLGIVLAPDQKSAIEEAIEYYKITDPEMQRRLVARPED
jgi:hypothetical protein